MGLPRPKLTWRVAIAAQRPVGQLDARLVARPFWDAAYVPAARALEASYGAIMKELQGLMAMQARGEQGKMPDVFAPYKSATVQAGAVTASRPRTLISHPTVRALLG